jgi:hypothetical protein
MPQYLLSVFQEEGAEPPAPEHAEMIMARVAAVQEEMKAAGAWVFFGALTDASSATVVRAADGEMSMTDGPYAEAKEQIGGFTVIEAADQTRRRERRHVVDRPQPRRPRPAECVRGDLLLFGHSLPGGGRQRPGHRDPAPVQCTVERESLDHHPGPQSLTSSEISRVPAPRAAEVSRPRRR